jgi:hypothetical protein
MKSRLIFPLVTLLVISSASTLRGEADVSLKGIMDADTYAAAGLDKLSLEEQAVLARWIQQKETTAEAQVEERIAQVVEERVAEERERAVEERKKAAKRDFGLDRRDEFAVEGITAKIRGDFEGWLGKSRFYLDNGQVWEQRISGTYYKYMKSPEVTIKKEALGYWMTVTKTGARVAVLRVR